MKRLKLRFDSGDIGVDQIVEQTGLVWAQLLAALGKLEALERRDLVGPLLVNRLVMDDLLVHRLDFVIETLGALLIVPCAYGNSALSAMPKAQPRRVVLDADTRRVLWIGEGRSWAAVRPFFEEQGPEGCARIETVAMDMNTAFDLEVRQHCPKA